MDETSLLVGREKRLFLRKFVTASLCVFVPLIIAIAACFGFLSISLRYTTAEHVDLTNMHALSEASRSLILYRDALISNVNVGEVIRQVDRNLTAAPYRRAYDNKAVRDSMQKLRSYWAIARRDKKLNEADRLIALHADAMMQVAGSTGLAHDQNHAVTALAHIQLFDIPVLRAQVHFVSVGLMNIVRHRSLTFKERVTTAAILTQVQTNIDTLTEHYTEAGRNDYDILRQTSANAHFLHLALDPYITTMQNIVEFGREDSAYSLQAASIAREFSEADVQLTTLRDRTSSEIDGILLAREAYIQFMTAIAQIASIALGGLAALLLSMVRPKLLDQARKEARKEAEHEELRREHNKRVIAEQALASTSAFRVAVMERAPVGIASIDVDGKIFDYNPYLKDILGDLSVDIVSEHRERFLAVLHNQEESLNFERKFITERGRERWADITITRIEKGAEAQMLGICMVRDVTARKDVETRLNYDATHDNLTKLGNRKLFRSELSTILTQALVSGDTFAVLFIDLDLFKDVNDTHGHEAGDHVLVTAGARLKEAVKAGDLVARFGGDEFAVIIKAPVDLAKAEEIATAMVRSLAEPIAWGEGFVYIGSSIGLAMGPADAESCDDIMRYADTAMYAAKEGGRGRYIIFDPEMQKSARQSAQLVNDLQTALHDSAQIHIIYQPIVDLARDAVFGFEALVCWDHPEFGEIPRDEFTKIAEKSGAIRSLGRRVMREACEQFKALGERVPSAANLSLSVNIAPSELATPNFVESMVDVMRATDFNPGRLYLEVTENIMIANGAQSKRIMTRLRELGLRISIDDFGAEYSSLRYLQELRIDLLKIDRGFLQEQPNDNQSGRAVLRAIANLAASFSLPAVAVGVDTAEQLAFVRELGCKFAQGALWGKPMAIAEVERRLSGRRRASAGKADTAAS